MKRCQVSVEFIILFFVVFVFFSAVSSVTVARMELERSNQRAWEAKQVVEILYNEINNAGISYGNYSRTFKLPDRILGKEYNITIKDGELIKLTLNNKNYYKWLKYKVNGQPLIGENTISKFGSNITLN